MKTVIYLHLTTVEIASHLPCSIENTIQVKMKWSTALTHVIKCLCGLGQITNFKGVPIWFQSPGSVEVKWSDHVPWMSTWKSCTPSMLRGISWPKKGETEINLTYPIPNAQPAQLGDNQRIHNLSSWLLSVKIFFLSLWYLSGTKGLFSLLYKAA